MLLAMRIWLTILVCWPAPAGPWWTIVLPMHSRSGRTASTASVSPPTMIDRAAFLAPTSPPETGASTLCDALRLGRVVDFAGPATARWWSCRPGPCLAWLPASAPCGPRKTSRTSLGKPTMAKTTSDCSATCLGRVGPGGAGLEQRSGLVAAAVVDRRLVALGDQVLAHPAAHHAGADPADARLSGFRLRHAHGSPQPALLIRSARDILWPAADLTRFAAPGLAARWV